MALALRIVLGHILRGFFKEAAGGTRFDTVAAFGVEVYEKKEGLGEDKNLARFDSREVLHCLPVSPLTLRRTYHEQRVPI